MVITLNFTTAPLHISASKDLPFPIFSLPNDIENLILAHYLKPWERRALSYVNKRFYYRMKDIKPLKTLENCSQLIKSATKIGSLSYIKWICENWNMSEPYNKYLACSASKGAYPDVLKWLLDKDCTRQFLLHQSSV